MIYSEYEREGIVGPFSVKDRVLLQSLKDNLDKLVESRKNIKREANMADVHLDCKTVYDLTVDENIIDIVSNILGENLVIYDSCLFVKYPGDRVTPWHQDYPFFRLEPKKILTVWLAIDDCDTSNSTLEFIPRSHFQEVPHVSRTNRITFAAVADPDYVNDSLAVSREVPSGNFLVFHPKLLHYAPTNMSMKRRGVIAIRFTTPDCKISHGSLYAAKKAMLVSGVDAFKRNSYGVPPNCDPF